MTTRPVTRRLQLPRWRGAVLVSLLSVSGAVSATVPAPGADVFPQGALVSLRLDRSLLLSRVPASDADRAALPASYRVGVSLLASRVQRERAEARAIAERVSIQTQLLAGRERHVNDLRQLLSSQDQLIGALQGRLREVEHQRLVAASAPRPSPVVAAEKPPAPVRTSVAAPVPSFAATATPLPAARSWPASAELLVQAGALVLVVALLGWMLTLRSRQAGDRLAAEAAARAAKRADGNDGQLREALSRHVRKTHVAPELASATLEPLEMPTAKKAVGMTAGPGPLSVVRGRGTADSKLLKEVDTLIAFEDYERASALLHEQVEKHPRNAEYRLRLLHIESARGNGEASEAEEAILANIMMDGPLSATIDRVLCAGRDMLPGHPLFETDQGRAAQAGDTAPVERTLRLVPPAR